MPQQRLELHVQHHDPLQTSPAMLPPLNVPSPLSCSPWLPCVVRLTAKMKWLPLLLTSCLWPTCLYSNHLAKKPRTHPHPCLLFRSLVTGTQLNIVGTHPHGCWSHIKALTSDLLTGQTHLITRVYPLCVIGQFHVTIAKTPKNWLIRGVIYLTAVEISIQGLVVFMTLGLWWACQVALMGYGPDQTGPSQTEEVRDRETRAP